MKWEPRQARGLEYGWSKKGGLGTLREAQGVGSWVGWMHQVPSSVLP